MKTSSQVVVCGAGPVGLLSALKFAQAGLEVTVIEAEAEINASPRACVYLPSSLEGLELIGLLEDVEKISFRSGRVGRHVPAYDYFQALDTRRFEEARLNYVLHVGQEEIGALIFERLKAMPNVDLRWNTELTGLTQRDEGVSLQVLSGGASETIDCDWLVGADGGRSAVRTLAGIDFDGHTWPDRFFAANVTFDFSRLGLADGNFRCDPESWAVIPRVNNRGVWRIAFGEDADLPLESLQDRLPGRLRDFIPEGERYELLQINPYRVHQRAAATLRQGRFVLAGDAAHVTNPIGGLGLTTGIWDALILGDVLPAVVRGEEADSALDAYSKARLGVFWNITSPAATENKRILQERDPGRREADMAAYTAFATASDTPRVMVQSTYAFIGDPVVEGSRWRQYAPH